jgi:EmrB/QacA subfamily drug resistance transporter
MRRIEYKWLVAIVYTFGLFMSLLDMTIVNVALPTIKQEFNASTTTIEWVVTGYLLSLAVCIPISGWLGDRFGTKRIYLTAFALFTLASLLCSLAWSVESLVAFRILQGAGGGMLTPVGTAMLYRAFPPHERARASSVISIPTSIGPAMGPVLGGLLTEYLSWRWVFLINLPIGLAGLAFAALSLREQREARPGRLDVPGLLLAAPGLAALVYALAEAGSHGWDSPRVLLVGLTGFVLLSAFVLVEFRTAEPLIDMRLFANRLFSAANTGLFLAVAVMIGAGFLLPLLLQAERGLTPLQSGLTTFPSSIGVAMLAPFVGRLYPRFGPRRIAAIGLIGLALTSLALGRMDLGTNLWWIRGTMLVVGFAWALTIIALQTAMYATITPAQMGRASAAGNSLRQVAASFGVAVLATTLTLRMTAHDAQLGNPLTQSGAVAAFQDAFFVAAALAALGAVACLLISDRLALTTGPRPAPDTAPGRAQRSAATGD